MELLNELKALVPDYAKDIRINLDSTITRSSLAPADALGAALAAAYAARSQRLAAAIRGSEALPEQDAAAALSAAALMGMYNVWYPYVSMSGDADLKALPAQLRIQAYATHGGVDKRRFELFALAASIVGKTGGGFVSDFWRRELVYALGMIGMIAGVGVLWLVALAPSAWLALGYAALFGVGYSVTAFIVPAMMSDRFRGPHFGSIFGATAATFPSRMATSRTALTLFLGSTT